MFDGKPVREIRNEQARYELSNTDWKVIRELEKLHLADTPLHISRQALRDSIIDEVTE